MTAKVFKDVGIDDVLSKAEQRRFAVRLWEAMRRGFGKVAITVEKGHPRRIESSATEMLPKPNDTEEE